MNWINNIEIGKALLVFVAYVILDYLYAKYTIYIQNRQAFRAGLSGAMMYSLMAWGIIIYTNHPIYIIFVALGSFCGTYFAVKSQKKLT